MTAHLALTAAGRAALADAANRQIVNLKLKQLAVGSGLKGQGDDDDARVAMRDAGALFANLGGDTSVAGRIALRADYAPASDFRVVEIGVWAAKVVNQVEQAQHLFAYVAVGTNAEAFAAAVANTALVVAGVLDVTNTAATLNVAASVTVQVGDNPAAILDTDHATTTARGIVELATAAETTTGTDAERATTPLGVKAAIDAAVAAIRGGVDAAYDTLAELAAGVTDLLTRMTNAESKIITLENQVGARQVTIKTLLNDTPVAAGTIFLQASVRFPTAGVMRCAARTRRADSILNGNYKTVEILMRKDGGEWSIGSSLQSAGQGLGGYSLGSFDPLEGETFLRTVDAGLWDVAMRLKANAGANISMKGDNSGDIGEAENGLAVERYLPAPST